VEFKNRALKQLLKIHRVTERSSQPLRFPFLSLDFNPEFTQIIRLQGLFIFYPNLNFYTMIKLFHLYAFLFFLVVIVSNSYNAKETNQTSPVELIDNVIIPVPSEVFSVLNKLGATNWAALQKPIKWEKTKERTKLALYFGMTVAEGFLTVQSKDKKALQNVGKEIIRLAEALAIKDSVTPHAQSIINAAEAGNWQAVHHELDITQKTVREEMHQMNDEKLAHLVSLGGWLCGTRMVSTLIENEYSTDRAEVLNQQLLVQHFISVLGNLEFSNNGDLQKNIEKTLQNILTTMEQAEQGIKLEQVSYIKNQCLFLESIINL
jgi:hypothetical protein